ALAHEAQRLAAVDDEVHAAQRLHRARVRVEVEVQVLDLQELLVVRLHASLPQARIQEIAQAVAQEVEAEHEAEDGKAGNGDRPPRALHVLLALRDEVAPLREAAPAGPEADVAQGG